MEDPLPVPLRYAYIKELLGERLLDFCFDGLVTNPILMEKGIRQGACDSSLLFALIVSHISFSLDASWKARNFCITFGKFGGNGLAFAEFFDAHFGHFLELDVQNIRICALVFIDDLYLICSNPKHAQIMLDELILELEKAGLSLNAQKCNWMCDQQSWETWGHVCLNFSKGVLKGPVKQLKVLGSIITFDSNETATIEHRIGQAWRCFNKWQHILLATASIDVKMQFWLKTVYRPLTWGLQTTRANEKLNSRLATTQRMMVRKMLKLKRWPIVDQDGTKTGTEPWLDWQIRSMTRASSEMRKRHLEIGPLLDGERKSWAARVSRLGLGPDDCQHLCKYLVAWRSKYWWEAQKMYNDLGWDTLKHVFPFKPRRWEDSLPLDWMITFCNDGPLGILS